MVCLANGHWKVIVMKGYHAVIVFLILSASALFSGVRSYRLTESCIVEDMNRALELTLKEKLEEWLTPDTIRNYRRHLRMEELRRRSYVYYAMDDRHRGLTSAKMRWQGSGRAILFQSYANCSVASVWSMSDQSVSMSLSLLSLLWMVFAMMYFRKHRQRVIVLGNIVYDEVKKTFYDVRHAPVRFTPMQHALMLMFYTTECHVLDKQKICDTLWPKKPDASETLYTLVKRLKPIVEEKGNLRIVSERGKAYRLVVKG